MKIKTVCFPTGWAAKFDEAVNLLVDEGWKLSRREVLAAFAPGMLYAELFKLEEADMETLEDEPITWQEAVNVLRETCEIAKDCDKDGCPVFAWCQRNLDENSNPPASWDDPEELEQPE